MSAQSANTQDEPARERHPAVRMFASEFLDSKYVFTMSDSDMAPNYTLLPSGKRVNRVLAVGVITSITDYSSEDTSGSGSNVQATLNDGSSLNFYLTASQYQADAAATLKDLIDETPVIVAVVGKPDHYETNDGEHRINIRPEMIVEVSKEDRDQWVLETARATRDRVERFVEADGADEAAVPHDVEMAQEQYDIDPTKYLDDAVDILDSMFGDGSDEE